MCQCLVCECWWCTWCNPCCIGCAQFWICFSCWTCKSDQIRYNHLMMSTAPAAKWSAADKYAVVLVIFVVHLNGLKHTPSKS